MTASDYPATVELWQRTEGLGLGESDGEAAVTAFLRRNPDLSMVALSETGEIIGAVLCGHDGRRGYLHHLAVATARRGEGIGKRLVERCLEGLAAQGIAKCNVFLFSDNRRGAAFWQHDGWLERGDLVVFQKRIGVRTGSDCGPRGARDC